MPEGIEIEFTDDADFEEVKTFLGYFAEKRLPIGTPYELVYDPDAAAFYGKVKSLSARICDTLPSTIGWEMRSLAPRGEFLPEKGLYLVERRVTMGNVPLQPEHGLERLRGWANSVLAVYDEREQVLSHANEET